jgi:hypothetical protein
MLWWEFRPPMQSRAEPRVPRKTNGLAARPFTVDPNMPKVKGMRSSPAEGVAQSAL